MSVDQLIIAEAQIVPFTATLFIAMVTSKTTYVAFSPLLFSLILVYPLPQDYLKSVVPSQLVAERGSNLVVINPGFKTLFFLTTSKLLLFFYPFLIGSLDFLFNQIFIHLQILHYTNKAQILQKTNTLPRIRKLIESQSGGFC